MLMPFFILIGVIKDCREDVHKKKCQHPIKLLITGYVVMFFMEIDDIQTGDIHKMTCQGKRPQGELSRWAVAALRS
jgi:hypothetical protein